MEEKALKFIRHQISHQKTHNRKFVAIHNVMNEKIKEVLINEGYKVTVLQTPNIQTAIIEWN